MNCEFCNDTGSISKNLNGYLDCTYCEIATERAAFEMWVLKNVDNCDDVSTAWLIYQYGKAAGSIK